MRVGLIENCITPGLQNRLGLEGVKKEGDMFSIWWESLPSAMIHRSKNVCILKTVILFSVILYFTVPLWADISFKVLPFQEGQTQIFILHGCNIITVHMVHLQDVGYLNAKICHPLFLPRMSFIALNYDW